jgi:hypothetical protein
MAFSFCRSFYGFSRWCAEDGRYTSRERVCAIASITSPRDAAHAWAEARSEEFAPRSVFVMIRRRRSLPTPPPTNIDTSDGFYDWVLSLPWVVERPYGFGSPGVRSFAVDCTPLHRQRMWMVTGLCERGIAVIVPDEAACAIEDRGWARILSPMPAEHVLMVASDVTAANPRTLEALVLAAYGCAMA